MTVSTEEDKLNDHREDVDLDSILVHLGHFGKFQRKNYLLICIVVIYAAFPLSYVFTTRKSEYRCFIEDLDDPEFPVYDAFWRNISTWNNSGSKQLDQCSYYPVRNDEHVNVSLDMTQLFKCNNFIFKNGDATIERDFNITCDNNLWKLTMVGTMDNIGELFFLSLFGFLSDKFGRRTMMVIGVVAGSICGIIKSFTMSYASFLTFEVLEMALSCGVYSASFILAVELVPPQKRVLASTVISCAFAMGEALLGLIARLTQSWRLMLRVLYVPGVLFLLYFWLVNESVRWLLSKGRVREAKLTLLHVARVNGTNIPEEMLQKLSESHALIDNKKESFSNLFKSRRIMLRLFRSSILWIGCVFVYYGFTLHAVAISGNFYFNFIAVTCIEMPAYFMSYYTLNVMGRKKSLAGSLLVAAVASFAFIFVPEESRIIRLIIFLVGKFSITISFTTLYIYTTELFPTRLRHQCLATCSTLGRIGSMIAPQIPLLTKISPSLPLIMFGGMASCSGLLSLTFPETLNAKLPETINETKVIQQKKESTETE